MAVPVQTWGALGSMVAEQREFGTNTDAYLEAHEVHDLCAHLLQQIIISQPADPIAFLQDQLRSKPPLAVCVIGPPGINRSKYCAQLEETYKIKHIHVGKLLRQKKDLKDQTEAGALVDDQIVINLVKAEIKKAEKTGWVLDGFPRTRLQAQALALRETGFALDKVILLNTSESTIRQRYAAKAAVSSFKASDNQDLITSRLQQYQRHVISIMEFFKNVIRQIEVTADDHCFDSVMSTLTSSLHVRPYSNAPLRSQRISVVGCPGSGRTTQSRMLAKQYGLVHVDVAALLRKHQQAQGLTPDGMPPEWVEDEELCAVVGKRLADTDCLRKGWVLDGFPNTPAQAEFLRQAHHWPSRMFHITVSEAVCAARMVCRKVDPATGVGYHQTPGGGPVAERLAVADFDSMAKVKERYRLHSQRVGHVMRVFPVVCSPVAAEVEVDEVFKTLCTAIDEPLPTELAQDPNYSEQ